MIRKIPRLLFLLFLIASPQTFAATSLPPGVVNDSLVAAVYQGGEKLAFRVSWSGGIKIGELHMEVNRIPGKAERYEIRARVKDSGLFHSIYPVDDSFVTIVAGRERLPVSYEVHQKEGRDYEALRITEYDQQNRKIRYRKNDQQEVEYQVKGKVYNEFSAFFFTRIMQLDPEQAVTVPTFADGKRHEVVVKTGRETRINNTIRGDVNVLPVAPVMKFKGLYDKAGDTVMWFTNDQCRIPVRINSKILIGSLTAELVSYSNPFCPDQSQRHAAIPEHIPKDEKLGAGD